MFFEPTQFPDTIGILGGIVVNLGFTAPPGGQNNSTKHVLNDHTYCCQLSPEICATGEPTEDKEQVCREWHEKRIQTRGVDAELYGIPLFISEFGACLNSSSCVREINAVADNCDEQLAGWAYWQLKNYADLTTSAGTNSEGFYNNDGTLQDGKVRALTRTYLQATQGILTSMQFSTQTSDFHAMFIVDTTIAEPTVLYKSDYYWYSTGFNINVVDSRNNILVAGKDYTIDLSQKNYARILVTNKAFNGQTLNIAVSKNFDSQF